MAPFSYTKFKIPLEKEQDLVPLTPSKKLSTERTEPLVKELDKEYTKLSKEKNHRKRKIKSLITQRNDREYYLSLNTNQFKVKLQHLKKMNSAIQDEINRKIRDKKKQIQIWKTQEQKLKQASTDTTAKGQLALFNKGMSEGQLRNFMSSERQLKAKKYEARQ